GRHDHRPGAAALHPGAAVPAAEHRDLRGVPADRVLPPTRHVRPRGGTDLRRVTRRTLARDLLAIAAVALVFLLLLQVVGNAYYRLILTLVALWATLGLAWNMLS